MKKYINKTSVIALVLLSFLACKKNHDDSIIKPTYKEEAPGTASNPFPNNQVITNTTTVSDPPTKNSSLNIGGAGWTNPSCVTTSSLYLKANYNDTEVTLGFDVPPPIGTSTYNVASSAGIGAVSITILKAPSQPAATVWHGRSGVVIVSSTGSAINAVITGTGICCLQATFNSPQVTLTGALGCN